jgi:hypothetical protein
MENKTKYARFQYLYTYLWVLFFIAFLFSANHLFPKEIPYTHLLQKTFDPAVVNHRYFWSIVHYKYCSPMALKLVVAGIVLLLCLPGVNYRFLDTGKRLITRTHNFFGQRLSFKAFSLLISSIFILLFWTFRLTNRALSTDAIMVPKAIQRAMAAGRMYIAPDEILPSLTNYFSYRLFSATLGWSIESSIGLLSCLWGGVFIYLLVQMVRYLQENPVYQSGAVLFFLFSGFIQIYFGDIENYALPYLIVTLYIYSSFKYLSEKDYGILLPTAIWFLSLFSHVLTFTFTPSLLYLWLLENKRQAIKLLVSILIILAFISALGSMSIPIAGMFHISNMLSLTTVMKKIYILHHTPFSAITHRLIACINEAIFVSLPSLMIIGYFLFFHFNKIDFNDRIIRISFINVLSSVFCLLILGPFSFDWNLFAFIAIANAMLAMLLFFKIPLVRKHYYHLVIYLIISLFHTAILILSSHYLST